MKCSCKLGDFRQRVNVMVSLDALNVVDISGLGVMV